MPLTNRLATTGAGRRDRVDDRPLVDVDENL